MKNMILFGVALLCTLASPNLLADEHPFGGVSEKLVSINEVHEARERFYDLQTEAEQLAGELRAKKSHFDRLTGLVKGGYVSLKSYENGRFDYEQQVAKTAWVRAQMWQERAKLELNQQILATLITNPDVCVDCLPEMIALREKYLKAKLTAYQAERAMVEVEYNFYATRLVRHESLGRTKAIALKELLATRFETNSAAARLKVIDAKIALVNYRLALRDELKKTVEAGEAEAAHQKVHNDVVIKALELELAISKETLALRNVEVEYYQGEFARVDSLHLTDAISRKHWDEVEGRKARAEAGLATEQRRQAYLTTLLKAARKEP